MIGAEVITGAAFAVPSTSGASITEISLTLESVISNVPEAPDISPGPPHELSPLISEPNVIL